MERKEQHISRSDSMLADKIYRLRDENVMLDRDLADLYNVSARRLREQVRRNAEKFPEHFMFQLTSQEVDAMVSQNAIPSRQHLGGALPYAFTEHGVLMLSNVLKSELATKMSIKLIEIFVHLRRSLNTQNELKLEIEQIKNFIIHQSRKQESQDKNIELLFEYVDRLQEKLEPPVPQERQRIGYKIGENKDSTI